MQKMMRAIRVAQFGGPEVLKLDSKIAIPKPDQNEVLIKVHAAGVNPVDTYIRSGTFSQLPSLPYTPGKDAAGVVEAVGPGVNGFKIGDRVLTMLATSGSYAEYAAVHEQYVCHLDDRLSFQQGACIGVPYYTAYKSLHIRAHAKPGETVLIHGASGAVGIAAVQLSKAFGMTVFGTAGSKEGLELVKEVGADAVFNHKEDGYLNEIQKHTGGQGVDIILEMLSNVNLQNDLTLLKYRGRVIIIGCRGTIEIDPRQTMGNESSILGVALMTSTSDEWREMNAAIKAGQYSGVIVPKVGQLYSLSEANIAQSDVINKTATAGNLILDVNR